MGYIENLKAQAEQMAKAKAFDDMQSRATLDKVYNQGRVDRDAEAGYNQSKSDLAMQIYKGTPNEAGLATEFAMNTGILNEAELEGIINARQVGEMQNRYPTDRNGEIYNGLAGVRR